VPSIDRNSIRDLAARPARRCRQRRIRKASRDAIEIGLQSRPRTRRSTIPLVINRRPLRDRAERAERGKRGDCNRVRRFNRKTIPLTFDYRSCRCDWRDRAALRPFRESFNAIQIRRSTPQLSSRFFRDNSSSRAKTARFECFSASAILVLLDRSRGSTIVVARWAFGIFPPLQPQSIEISIT